MGKKDKPHLEEHWIRHAAEIGKAIAKAEKKRLKRMKKAGDGKWLPKEGWRYGETVMKEPGDMRYEIERCLKAGGFLKSIGLFENLRGFSVQTHNVLDDTFTVRLHKEEDRFND